MGIWLTRGLLATLLVGVIAAALVQANHAQVFNLGTALKGLTEGIPVVSFLLSGLSDSWRGKFDTFVAAHPAFITVTVLWGPVLGLTTFVVRGPSISAAVPAATATATIPAGRTRPSAIDALQPLSEWRDFWAEEAGVEETVRNKVLFVGRAKEREELMNFARTDDAFAWKNLFGAEEVGKTRLAHEWLTDLAKVEPARDAGFKRDRAELSLVADATLARPFAIVIDNADTLGAKKLWDDIEKIRASHRNGRAKIRILLVSRYKVSPKDAQARVTAGARLPGVDDPSIKASQNPGKEGLPGATVAQEKILDRPTSTNAMKLDVLSEADAEDLARQVARIRHKILDDREVNEILRLSQRLPGSTIAETAGGNSPATVRRLKARTIVARAKAAHFDNHLGLAMLAFAGLADDAAVAGVNAYSGGDIDADKYHKFFLDQPSMHIELAHEVVLTALGELPRAKLPELAKAIVAADPEWVTRQITVMWRDNASTSWAQATGAQRDGDVGRRALIVETLTTAACDYTHADDDFSLRSLVRARLTAFATALEMNDNLTDHEVHEMVRTAIRHRPDSTAIDCLAPIFEVENGCAENRPGWADLLRVFSETRLASLSAGEVVRIVTDMRESDATIAAAAALKVMDTAYRHNTRLNEPHTLFSEELPPPDAALGLMDALTEMVRSGVKSRTVPATFALLWITSARSIDRAPSFVLHNDHVEALIGLLRDPQAHAMAVTRASYVVGKAIGQPVDPHRWSEWARLVDRGGPAPSPRAAPVIAYPELVAVVQERLKSQRLDAQTSAGLANLGLRLGVFFPAAAESLARRCLRPDVQRDLVEEIILRAVDVGGEDVVRLLKTLFNEGSSHARFRSFLGLAALGETGVLARPDGGSLQRDGDDEDEVDFDDALSRLKERAHV